MGSPFYATSPGKAAQFLPIVGARGRSSGRNRCAGLGRRGAFPAQGAEPRTHGGPLERPGTTTGGSPWDQRTPSDGSCRGRDCTRGRLPWGPFPPGQKRSRRPAHRLWGPSAATRGGGAAEPGPRLGRRGCLMLVVTRAAWHCAPRQTAAQEPRTRRETPCPPQHPATAAPANNVPMRPVPRPRLWRPRPRRTPPTPAQLPCPALRVPAFPVCPTPPTPIIFCCRPSAKAPLSPPARPPEAATTSPPGQAAERSGCRQHPPGNSPALPSPAPGGSLPWLGLSVPEPPLPVRRQKPAGLGRQPPRRPSAPPPRRGLSSREGGGRAPLDLTGGRAPGRVPASPGALRTL